MMQPSLSLLTLTIREATNFLGSVRTLDAMPDRLQDGFVDMIMALTRCFPEAAEEFDYLTDTSGLDFNFAAEAYRLVSPLVDQMTYPLHTEYGTMFEDTPLVMALAPGNALDLIKDCIGHEDHLTYEPDANALFDMTLKLTHTYPSIAAELDVLLDEGGVGYYEEAYKLLTEALNADRPQLAMAA